MVDLRDVLGDGVEVEDEDVPGSGESLLAPSGWPLLSARGGFVVEAVAALGRPVGGVEVGWGADSLLGFLPDWDWAGLPGRLDLDDLSSSARVVEGVRKRISRLTLPSPPITVLVIWTVPPSPL